MSDAWLNPGLPLDQLAVPPGVLAHLGEGGADGDGSTIDMAFYSIFSPEFYSGTTDAKLALATTAAELVNGAVQLKAQTYTLTVPWIVPNNVDVIGVHPTRTIFSPAAGFCGPVLVSWPTYEDPRHAFRKIGIKGNLVGCVKTTGTVTKDSNVITAVAAGDINDIHVDDKIEGIGLDDDTFVTAVNVGALTVTVTNVGKFYRTGITVATATKLVVRRGYAFTATVVSLTGNAVLTVTVGGANIVNVKKWAFCAGANLDTDAEDLSTNNRVMATSVGGSTITLDRPAKTLGSFALRTWEEVEGWLAPETEFYNPILGPLNKAARAMTLDFCICEGTSGTGCKIRPKRDQFFALNATRMASCHGYGYSITASNDSQIDSKSGGGSNWKCAFRLSSSATFRWGGGECWDTQVSHLFTDAAVRGCRQFTAFAGDINGRWYIKGKGVDEANHGIRLFGWNWKWHKGDGWPDGTADAYLIIDSAQVELISPYWYPDREYTPNARPDYLWKLSNGSLLTVIGGRIITNAASDFCPFEIDIEDKDVTSFSTGFYVRAEDNNVVHLGQVTMPQALHYTSNAYDARPATNGNSRDINGKQLFQILSVSGTIATYGVNLPYIHTGSAEMFLTILGGNITAMTWQAYGSDDTTLTAVASSSQVNSSTRALFPNGIFGLTTLRFVWREDALQWYLVSVQKGVNAWITLADVNQIVTDANLSHRFKVTLAGNRTYKNPDNPYDGQNIKTRFKQDATGSRIITWGSKIKMAGGAQTLTTTANAIDQLDITYDATDDLWYGRLDKGQA